MPLPYPGIQPFPQKMFRETMFFGKSYMKKIILWSKMFERHLAKGDKTGFLWCRTFQSLYWLCLLGLTVTAGSGTAPLQALLTQMSC